MMKKYQKLQKKVARQEYLIKLSKYNQTNKIIKLLKTVTKQLQNLARQIFRMTSISSIKLKIENNMRSNSQINYKKFSKVRAQMKEESKDRVKYNQ